MRSILPVGRQGKSDQGRGIRRRTILALTGLFVVASVFYLLSYPAVTLDKTPFCGLEEHVHTQECFTRVLGCDIEDEDAPEAPVAADGGSSGYGEAIPDGEQPVSFESLSAGGAAVVSPHVHTDACYAEVMTCGQAEHAHDEACFPLSDMGMIVPLALDPDGYSSDLRDFLDKVVIMGPNGIVEDNDPVYIGEYYKLTFFFSELYTDPGFRQFKYNADGWLTYQLPGDISVLEGLVGRTNEIKHSSSGNTIGEYIIEASGLLKVKFRSGINERGDLDPGSSLNYIEFLNVNFNIEFSARVVGIPGEKDIVFSDDLTIHITLRQRSGDLVVTKETVGEYVMNDHSINYRVKVLASGGLVNDISMTDVVTLQTGSFAANLPDAFEISGLVVRKYDKNHSLVGVIPVEVAYNTNTPGGSGLRAYASYDITFPDVPGGLSLDIDEYIILEYEMILKDKIFLGEPYVSSFPSGILRNDVGAAGFDENGGPVSDEDYVSDFFSANVINKRMGTVDTTTDPDKALIMWKAVLGDGHLNLSDFDSFTDILTNSKFYKDIPIMVERYRVNDLNQDVLDGTFTIPWTQLTVTQNPATNGERFTYKIPADWGEYKYVLTYYSEYPADGAAASVRNRIDLDGKNSHESGVIVGAALEKDGVIRYNAVDGYYIEYTLKIVLPGSVKGSAVSVTDDLTVYGLPTQIWNEPKDVNFVVRDLDGNEISPAQYARVGVRFDPSTPYRVHFYTCADPGSTSSGSWRIGEDCTLTITYKIPMTAQLQDGSGQTLEDFLLHNPVLNSSVYNYAMLYVGNQRYDAAHELPSMIYKEAKKAYSNNGTWVYEGGSNFSSAAFTAALARDDGTAGLWYTVRLNTMTLASLAPGNALPLFTDSFDDRLAYVPNTLYIDRTSYANSPARNYRYMGWSAAGGLGTPTPPANVTDLVNASAGKITLDFKDVCVEQSRSSPYNYMPLQDPHWCADERSVYYVNYVLAFPAGKAPVDKTIYENTANITIYNKYGEPITHSYTIETAVGSPVVTKDMAPAGQTADVEIDINPDARSLTEGQSEVVKVEDVMEHLSFYESSLVVEAYEGGEWKTYSTANGGLVFGSQGKYGYTTEGNNKITFYLPDATWLKIKYTVLIDGKVGDTVPIKNTVTVSGSYTAVYDKTYQIVESGGTGGASTGSLSLVKHDAYIHDKYLPGAVFDLYTSNTRLGVDTGRKIVVGGLEYYYYKTLPATGADGRSTLKDNSLLPGINWALVEIQAPEGYILNEDPILFVFGPAENDNPLIQVITDTIAIPNSGGAKLPETGGRGRTVFIIGGLLIMLLASGLLQYRQKGGRARMRL